jgi:hypothetical protein
VLVGHALEVQLRQPTAITSRPQDAIPSGAYRYRLTTHDLRAASRGRMPTQDLVNNAGIWGWTLHDGHWALHLRPKAPGADRAYSCSGDVTVSGDVATFVRTVNKNPVGECAPRTWSARFSVEGTVVHWSDVSVRDFGWVFATQPWARH